MDGNERGYREIEHTADWMLEVWAPDFTGLLEQAALGMYALSGIQLKGGERKDVILEMPMRSLERLLVEFLSELLYYRDRQGLAFERFHFRMEEENLFVRLIGTPVASIEKEIKAVTYHNLEIQKTETGLITRIVFDV